MDRRKMLKVLPLAAMVGATVKIGEAQAKAFEMKPDKKYLFVIPELSQDHALEASRQLRKRGINGIVCAGISDLTIYELDGE